MYKYILMLLFLVGCSLPRPDKTKFITNADTKLKAGQEVVCVSECFYSECSLGVIKGYQKYSNSQGIPYYVVDFYCPNVGWVNDVSVIETGLKLKE